MCIVTPVVVIWSGRVVIWRCSALCVTSSGIVTGRRSSIGGSRIRIIIWGFLRQGWSGWSIGLRVVSTVGRHGWMEMELLRRQRDEKRLWKLELKLVLIVGYWWDEFGIRKSFVEKRTRRRKREIGTEAVVNDVDDQHRARGRWHPGKALDSSLEALWKP